MQFASIQMAIKNPMDKRRSNHGEQKEVEIALYALENMTNHEKEQALLRKMQQKFENFVADNIISFLSLKLFCNKFFKFNVKLFERFIQKPLTGVLKVVI